MVEIIVKNFKRPELQCPCCGECKMDDNFLVKLQKLRDVVGFPLIISSAYRCKDHNASVGGVTTSQHKYGKAADIIVNHYTSKRRYFILSSAFKLKFSGIGIYKEFIHLDTREERKSLWVG